MNDILKLMQERISSRNQFDPDKRIPKEDITKILEAGRWSPTAHNMQNFEIIVVDDKKVLKEIGSIKYEISDIFIKENYQQLSFSEEELINKKVGLLAAMFPEFMRNPALIKNMTDEQRKNDFLGKLLETGPMLLIVLYDPSKRAPASEGDFLGIVSLGCIMENIWLMANSLGIAVHIVSSISAPGIENQVKKILSIPEQLKIAFSFRIGYYIPGTAKQLRVRRDIKDFTHQNKFGNKDF